MTLEQLRIFVTVAERLNMTQAAAALHLTQSAVSAAIAALEARHATKLFDRVGRGLALSEAGEVFLPEARAVLARADAAAQVIDDLSGLRRGRLSIAASQTVASYWLPRRLALFAQAHPAVRVDVTVSNSAQVAAAVLEGLAELGFVEGAVSAGSLRRVRVGSDRVGLFAAGEHPLGRAPVDAAALADTLWVLRESGSGTREQFDRAMRAIGLPPGAIRVALELPSNEALLAAVADSELVTAVSDLAAAPHVAAGRVCRLDLPFPDRAFDMITHADRHASRAATAFRALL